MEKCILFLSDLTDLSDLLIVKNSIIEIHFQQDWLNIGFWRKHGKSETDFFRQRRIRRMLRIPENEMFHEKKI